MLKLSNYVKLPTWLQFVGYFLVLGAIIGALRGHKHAITVGLISISVSAGAFLYRMLSRQLGGYDQRFRELLQVVSYALSGIGLVLLVIPFWPAVWLVYLGVGIGLAGGIAYEVIYP